MEFIYEKILLPYKRTFITRKLQMDPKANKIHSHKNFELNLITSGAGRRIVGNHISSYTRGDLVLLGPNLYHCWEIQETEDQQEGECIVTHFSENIINSDFFNIPELEPVVTLLKDAGNGIFFKGRKAEKVAASIGRMISLSGLELYIELLKVFNLLLQIEDREYLALPSSQPHVHEKDTDQINKVYEYVFQNIREGVKLKEASDLVCMEPGSFCRYFKKKTNQTFMDYVKNVRIGIAAKLLVETDKQITQICFECGYNNLANFNHYFKDIMGKTPSEYRKNFK
ncbi:AraC family transcriptional regulator [Gaoshiqia sp. Z1-71]|uniref:AraC family transcriptional regulator n=1 Tax=Gaoshiqia hydrogeniformans TaxID=3290090 RepID=UPI003BF8EE47